MSSSHAEPAGLGADRQSTNLTRALPWDAAGLFVAVSGTFLLLYKHRHFFHDDAYISLRYARNLAEHGVLEWNLGERFEGYTNFLHLLITAGLLKLGVAPELAVQSIAAGFALVLVAAVFLTLKRLAPEAPVIRAMLVATLGLTPGVAIWILGGLETVMVAALLAAGTGFVVACLQDGRSKYAALAGLCFSLSVLTRMDSAVYIGASGISVLLFAKAPFAARFMQSFLVGGVPALVSLAHMAWRIGFYGLAMPLTYYAKADMPLEFRLQFLNDLPTYVMFALPIWPIAVISALSVIVARDGDVPLIRALALPFLAASAYVIWSGGDHMAGARVLLPLVGGALFLVAAQPTQRKIIAPLMLVATLGAAVFSHAERKDGAAFFGELVADHINAHWPSGLTIALSTAGSTPFHADDHTYIDMLGLNDPHIAQRKDIPFVTIGQTLPGHGKGDGAYILSREPDVIILGPATGHPANSPSFLSDWELGRLPGFERCYELQSDMIHVDPALWESMVKVIARKTFYWFRRTCPKAG